MNLFVDIDHRRLFLNKQAKTVSFFLLPTNQIWMKLKKITKRAGENLSKQPNKKQVQKKDELEARIKKIRGKIGKTSPITEVLEKKDMTLERLHKITRDREKPVLEIERVQQLVAKPAPQLEKAPEEVYTEKYDAAKWGPLAKFETPPEYEEIERYWIEEPFALAVVLTDKKSGEQLYHLVEPQLSPWEEEVLRITFQYLQDELLHTPPSADREEVITSKTLELLKSFGAPLDPRTVHKIQYYVKRRYLGYDIIDAFMKDPRIEDVSCDGSDIPIFLYHRNHQNVKTNISLDADSLNSLVIRLAEISGKQLSLSRPMIDATLPEGSRLQATLGTQVTTRGSSFSIRKFISRHFTPVDLIKYNTFSPEMLTYLWMMAENNRSILVIGGTASGKTSTLNALAFFIPPAAKIVSIEDTRELSLYQENWIASVTREYGGEKEIDMTDLLRQAIRQRPEGIIVGEVRGREAVTLFQAMALGHATYSTMHAGDVQEAINRLTGEPMGIPTSMLTVLDVICVQLLTYHGRKRVRRNQLIVELTGLEPATRQIRINSLYRWDPYTDSFKKIGASEHLSRIARERGWSPSKLSKEFTQRQKILEYLVEKDITDPKEISSVLRSFYYNPEKIVKQIVSEIESEED